jgi:hypothetical protein
MSIFICLRFHSNKRREGVGRGEVWRGEERRPQIKSFVVM